MRPLILFLAACSLFAQDSGAIFQAALAKMQQAGALAQEGKFGPANQLIAEATAEIDGAVARSPQDAELRARRGLLYGRMTYQPGKTDTAAQDLRFAGAHLGELPEPLRQQISEKLADAHPDRFARVPADTSPVIAAASFTLPPLPGNAVPEWIGRIGRALDGYPGLLGKHAVSSVDHPGMFILFTWWKDKKALNDFFYSDLHQSWMRQRGVTMTGANPAPADAMPTQTAVEIFAGLPGGTQINGGFIPPTVFDMFKSAK